MSSLVEHLLHVTPALVLLGVAVLVFAEDAVFVGFVIPGETAAVLGGVDASRGHVGLTAVMVTVVVAAVVGDSVGYEVGRHLGPRLLARPVLTRHRDRVDGARAFLARRGGSAVLLGRFVAFFRAVMPALAGLSHMPYRRFLAWNVVGGVVWGVTFVLLGYLAGSSYAAASRTVGRGTAVGACALAVLAAVVWHVRRSRAARRGDR